MSTAVVSPPWEAAPTDPLLEPYGCQFILEDLAHPEVMAVSDLPADSDAWTQATEAALEDFDLPMAPASWRSLPRPAPPPPSCPLWADFEGPNARLLMRTLKDVVPSGRSTYALWEVALRGYERSLLVAALAPSAPEDDVPVLDPLPTEPEIPPPPTEDAVLVSTLAPNAPPAPLAGARSGHAA